MKKTKVDLYKHWLPISLILATMIAIYVSGIYHKISFHTLQEKHQVLQMQVTKHPVLAPLVYMGIFALAVAISLPVTDILGVIGGFLFPFPFNMVYIVIGSTVGASLIFLAARTAIRDFLMRKTAPFFKKMEAGFQKDAWCYLLFLRFVPLFPFWLVNIVSAFFNVSFLTFLWTTFIGIIPLSYIHAEIGAGLSTFLKKGDHFSIEAFFNPQIRAVQLRVGYDTLDDVQSV